MKVTKKSLEITVSKLFDYSNKKPSLEQYSTPSSIASKLVWNAYMNGDISDKVVMDLGCGNGILGISALLLGAKKVIFVDVDKKALEVCKKNLESFDLTNFKLINKNVVDVKIKVDIILMNPPFGVQTPNLDILFLKQSKILGKKIYLIYKGDGEKIIRKELQNVKFTLISKENLTLKNQFSFHSKLKQKTKILLGIIE